MAGVAAAWAEQTGHVGPGTPPKAAGRVGVWGDTEKRQILPEGVPEDLWILGDSVEQWGWKLAEGLTCSDVEATARLGLQRPLLPLPRQVTEKPVAAGRAHPCPEASSCFSAPCQAGLACGL